VEAYFKEETLKVIKNIVGHVKVTEFTPAHAAFFEKERRKSVAGPTVNRGLAVLSHMFTFALKMKGIIQIHPMMRYGRNPRRPEGTAGHGSGRGFFEGFVTQIITQNSTTVVQFQSSFNERQAPDYSEIAARICPIGNI
jgi:hypothetical protein